MITVKKMGKKIRAYPLREENPVIEALISEGKIKKLDDGTFEIMSQEAVKGGSGKGQVASANDYVKIDSSGFPYPNDEAYFIANHIHIEGDEYEQITKPLAAWTANEPMCEEVNYLVEHKGLIINENDPKHYLTAMLWGTLETVERDGAIVFYDILRTADGRIEDISFNFVAHKQFHEEYTVIDEE